LGWIEYWIVGLVVQGDEEDSWDEWRCGGASCEEESWGMLALEVEDWNAVDVQSKIMAIAISSMRTWWYPSHGINPAIAC
jgi:hypothetical protein